jgi:hypothetical protein
MHLAALAANGTAADGEGHSRTLLWLARMWRVPRLHTGRSELAALCAARKEGQWHCHRQHVTAVSGEMRRRTHAAGTTANGERSWSLYSVVGSYVARCRDCTLDAISTPHVPVRCATDTTCQLGMEVAPYQPRSDQFETDVRYNVR